jgi:coenzyme F420-dependent glucose-6-phosphate dehydrogenase
MEFGYKLSSEERTAPQLVDDAVRAEAAGFSFAAISDHFHPWIDRQGQSPFVWGVLGAIACAAERITVGTAVTCPTVRIHPAIVAHVSATAACLLPGRFFLGVGTGENLNEHVLGGPWPEISRRRAMLEEGVSLIRELWSGEEVTRRGAFFDVVGARLYSIPPEPPPLLVAASGSEAAELAGRIGDGLIATSPDREVLERFDGSGRSGRPHHAEITVCYAVRKEDALETALEWWPNPGIPGELAAELPLPRHFEQAAEAVRSEDLRGKIVLGSAIEPYLDIVGTYRDAGFDHLWFHQVGPDQEGFLDFAHKELLPALGSSE